MQCFDKIIIPYKLNFHIFFDIKLNFHNINEIVFLLENRDSNISFISNFYYIFFQNFHMSIFNFISDSCFNNKKMILSYFIIVFSFQSCYGALCTNLFTKTT